MTWRQKENNREEWISTIKEAKVLQEAWPRNGEVFWDVMLCNLIDMY
jgi:hypothetical protein